MPKKILPQNLYLEIDGTDIFPSSQVTNLGVILDETLSLDDHVNSICRKANYHLYCIGKIRHLLDERSCKTAINSLVISRLDFANSLLVGSPSILHKRLQSVQNNAARLITRTKKFDHITPVLTDLHWLPVSVRGNYKILLMVYKCLNHIAPLYLQSLLSLYAPSRSLRSSHDVTSLVKPMPKRAFGNRAFQFVAPALWNALPLNIRESPSVSSFKTNLKTYLFRNAYF